MSSETAGACLPYSLSRCFAMVKRGGSTPIFRARRTFIYVHNRGSMAPALPSAGVLTVCLQQELDEVTPLEIHRSHPQEQPMTANGRCAHVGSAEAETESPQ